MSKKINLQRLMSPRSIVMIGGSNLSLPIQNSRNIGFEGDIWVVNPKHKEVSGVRCFASIDDLPQAPDAAFVAVNAQQTVQAVKSLNAKGCGGVVCYAAGFSEAGGVGDALQQALIEAAGEMALVGPNCYGLLNFTNGVALWPDRLCGSRTEKGVAIISQSGNVALNLTMHDRSLPISHVISVGNQAVMGVGDYVEALLEDDSVRAIGFYIEGLKDISSFSAAALKALQKGVPLVVLKAGTSEVGTQLTMSHTSSLAGSDDMYQAMFDRLGVLRVHSLSEMLETLKVAALCQPPKGNRVGVLTCSGGDSAMLADSLDQHSLTLPSLNATQNKQLNQLLPDFASLSNPLDYNTSIWGDLAACEQVFSTMMAGDYDSIILALDFPKQGAGDNRPWQVAVDAMIAAHGQHYKTAAVICNLCELLPSDARQRLVDAGIAPLQGFTDGVAAINALVQYRQRHEQVQGISQPEQLILRQPSLNQGENIMLDEWASKNLMAQYGVSLPGGQLADLNTVSSVADDVGYPVVIKGVSDQLTHKTEAGAVKLNLKDADQVASAAAVMAKGLAQQGLNDVKFLIEPMISDFVAEMIIGLKRDEQFGLALILGTGGILVNLLNDSATLLLPTNRDAVHEALHSLQGSQLLQGYRGRPEGDMRR